MTTLDEKLRAVDLSKPSTRGTRTDENFVPVSVEERIGKVAVDAMMFEIGRLQLAPNDLLVMAPPMHFTVHQAISMAEAFRSQLDGHGIKNPVLVYAGGTRVGVLSPRKSWVRRLLGL